MNEHRSDFPIVRTGAAIGAVVGFSLQSATLARIALTTGDLPGPFELMAMCAIALVVTAVGATFGAFVGVVVKSVLAIVCLVSPRPGDDH